VVIVGGVDLGDRAVSGRFEGGDSRAGHGELAQFGDGDALEAGPDL
jgi:hypothetical protein